MVSLAELREVSQGKGKEHEKYLPHLTYILRPLSVPLSWVALKLNMTANQVSAISFALVFVSAALYLTATRTGFLWAGIILYLSLLLDCVDGTLARYTREKTGFLSRYGGFVDSLGSDFTSLFVWPAIGFGLFKNPALGYVPGWAASLVSPALYLCLGFLMTSFSLGQRVILARYVGLVGEKNVKGRLERLKEKDWRAIIQMNLTYTNTILAAFLASIFNILNWFLLLYVLASVAEYLFVLVYVILNVRKEQAKELESFSRQA